MFVGCFNVIPVLLYRVYNGSSAWFCLWAIRMCTLCTNLLYSILFVHIRFLVTCSSTGHLWAAMICHFQCSGIVSAIELVTQCFVGCT
jgi:hypothetical protein